MFVVQRFSKQDSGRHVMDAPKIAEWWGMWPTRRAKAPGKVGLSKGPLSACGGGPFRVRYLTWKDSLDTRRR